MLSSRYVWTRGLHHLRRGPASRSARTLSWLEGALRTGSSRGLREDARMDVENHEANTNDFIMSVLNASPSMRDTRSYRKDFLAPEYPAVQKPADTHGHDLSLPPLREHQLSPPVPVETLKEHPLLSSILEPVAQHTALVKIQGPFTDRQLESICRGLVYLEKLGLVSVIVVENDEWEVGDPQERLNAIEDAERVVQALEEQGANARPILQTVVRLGLRPGDSTEEQADGLVLNAHALPEDLGSLRSALRVGEIPVLAPLALDSHCRTVRVESDQVIAALARGMVEAAELDKKKAVGSRIAAKSVMDLTPLRLMIINREGGIPSYARNGLPHLLVNLESEFEHVVATFLPQWAESHPSAVSNLALAKICLRYMPRTSSAIMVSHRSPQALIGNLITNKPAQSSSLPHALLSGAKALTPNTPTLIRHGLPMRVIRDPALIDQNKMTALLEQSFGRIIKPEEFYDRIGNNLDFALIAGDYAGAAIVTKEQNPADPTAEPIAYLDKFAVLPSHQGDGTVDFLWVALRDESFGLGLLDASNPNPGGLQGRGVGRDLVWRSRADNPVNKWYFERSNGHIRLNTGGWVMFWCDAEDRLARQEKERRKMADGHRGVVGLSYVEEEEYGRLARWGAIVEKVPSSWVPKVPQSGWGKRS